MSRNTRTSSSSKYQKPVQVLLAVALSHGKEYDNRARMDLNENVNGALFVFKNV